MVIDDEEDREDVDNCKYRPCDSECEHLEVDFDAFGDVKGMWCNYFGIGCYNEEHNFNEWDYESL